MKISDAIKSLQQLPQDDEIIIAWWDRPTYFQHIKEEDWSYAVERIESKFDWSYTYEALDDHISIVLDDD
jgi:hypothetical protein